MTPKYKHMSFEDRCTIQEFLNLGYSFTTISKRIGKDRRTVSKEIFNHRFPKGVSGKWILLSEPLAAKAASAFLLST